MRKKFLAAIAIVTSLAVSFGSLPAQGAPNTHRAVSTSTVALAPTTLIVAHEISGFSVARSVAGHSRSGVQLTQARPTVAPIVVAVLAFIVRAGIKQAIKVFGRTAVKKALRSKLLSLNANKWAHILAPKHNWHKLGAAGNRGKVADLLTNAVAHGKRYPRGTAAYEYRWTTKGKTVVAVVSKRTGEISDGWVK